MAYPKGPAQFKVASQGFGVTKNDVEFFKLYGTVVSLWNWKDACWEPCQEYERELVFWMSEDSAKRSLSELGRLGWEGADLQELDPNTNQFSHDFAGQLVNIEITHREYEGKTYDRIQIPREKKAPESPQSAPGISAKLTTQLKGVLSERADRKAPPKKATKPAPVAASSIPDDDIPFSWAAFIPWLGLLIGGSLLA